MAAAHWTEDLFLRHPLGPDLSAEAPLHSHDLRLELLRRPFAVVDLDDRRDAFAVLHDGPVAARDEREDLVERALDHRPHGIEAIRETAAVHDVHGAGHVFPTLTP